MKRLPSPTSAYLKIITVSVNDISHMEEHHLPIKDISMARSYIHDKHSQYEICNLYVMHPELISAEDKVILEKNGIKY